MCHTCRAFHSYILSYIYLLCIAFRPGAALNLELNSGLPTPMPSMPISPGLCPPSLQSSEQYLAAPNLTGAIVGIGASHKLPSQHSPQTPPMSSSFADSASTSTTGVSSSK